MWWHNGYGRLGGFWLLGIFLRAFGLAVVVAVIVILVRRSGRSHLSGHGQEPNAREIARRRCARGEITKDQFEQLKRDLNQ